MCVSLCSGYDIDNWSKLWVRVYCELRRDMWIETKSLNISGSVFIMVYGLWFWRINLWFACGLLFPLFMFMSYCYHRKRKNYNNAITFYICVLDHLFKNKILLLLHLLLDMFAFVSCSGIYVFLYRWGRNTVFFPLNRDEMFVSVCVWNNWRLTF